MNNETSCRAQGRLDIIVGGKNVLYLIAEVWQNTKKNSTEKTEQEIGLEREKQLLISFFVLFWPRNFFSCFIESERLQIITKESFYSSLFAQETEEYQRNDGHKNLQ